MVIKISDDTKALNTRIIQLENQVTLLTSAVATLQRQATTTSDQWYPLQEVIARKLIDKSESTFHRWLKKAKIETHYRYCGKTVMINVEAFKKLMAGRR